MNKKTSPQKRTTKKTASSASSATSTSVTKRLSSDASSVKGFPLLFAKSASSDPKKPRCSEASSSDSASFSPAIPLPTTPRSQIAEKDTWNLQSLYLSDDAWEKDFGDWVRSFESLLPFKGRLSDPLILADFLSRLMKFEEQGENLGIYAMLKTTEDLGNAVYQEKNGRLAIQDTLFSEQLSFVEPELLALSQAKWKSLLKAPCLANWNYFLQQIAVKKPHTLSAKEERLLAMASEMSLASSNTFQALNNVELTFRPVQTENRQKKELTQESFQVFLHHPTRSIRKAAFDHLYEGLDSSKNTLASLLAGSYQKDVFYARAQNFDSALQAALFREQIPVSVYENLIQTVRRSLPLLHRYYELRRRTMKLREIHFYDTYIPMVQNVSIHCEWETSIEVICDALSPLGTEYVRTLRNGLIRDRWVDKFENLHKQNGAFSCSGYKTVPFILMNYKPEIIESVFTLAHEAGHSMHSWYSNRSQPFVSHQYAIFLAEIASTFNEELLTEFLLKTAENPMQRAWLINRELDAIRGTIFRQTMFSEFEKKAHETLEQGVPLTVKTFRSIYHELLADYFGPGFALDDKLSLECFRIPHFYRAFYVYKYATGMASAIALSQRVLNEGRTARQEYFELLKGGGAAKPLEILRRTGIDIEQPQVLDQAMQRFDRLLTELESLL